MSNRRGEKTVQESVEDILRPLAERRILPTCTCGHDGQGFSYGLCILHNGNPREVPDPRFEVLRIGDYVDTFHHFRGIDATLGAIVRAAAACGWWVTQMDGTQGWWYVTLKHAGHPYRSANGRSPEVAAARALVALVSDEKAT